MKNILIPLLLFVNIISFSQWNDNFTDGDFTAAPVWSGQTANFEIDGLNQLHLLAPSVTDTSYLSLASDAIENAVWEFYVELDFNPSSGNLARVYLTSNNADLKSALNGYFVMIGNTADEVSLYRQDGTGKTLIIDGVDGVVSMSPVTLGVKVTRDAVGNWQLFADNTGGTSYTLQGSVLDNTHIASAYAGVHCKYTSTRSDKFYFDNFIVTGTPYVDNVLPSIVSVTATSINTADILFSEDMEQISVETITNYSVNNSIGNPTIAIQDVINPAIVHLSFATNFTNNLSNYLTTTNVNDLALNTLVNSVDNFIYFLSDVPNPDDVIITEVMADYGPTQGLPEIEYVELYNASNKIFDLAGWTIGDATSNTILSTYVLEPNQYVILANGTTSTFGQLNILPISIPSYNNTGDAVVIKSDLGNVIDSINYDLTWYNNSDKDDGGWSLERKRLSNQCTDKFNWSASIASNGGTPGLQNSIFTTYADISAPKIIGYTVQGDSILILQFDEDVILQGDFNLSITPNLNVLSSYVTPNNTITVKIESMQPETIYNATVIGVANCWGTSMYGYEFKFGLASTATKSDIIINEIMFNPLSGGSDYIEIVNISNKIIDLKNWKLASISNDTIANVKTIINSQTFIFPNDYIVLTEDSTDIINDFYLYGIGTFLDTDLPTYSNDSATVILINDSSLVIDQVHYDEDYHFKLLTNVKGKALERLSFTALSSSEDNWHTASEIAEWGTPGYKNSQYIAEVSTGIVTINQPIFSPDNDGYQDVVTLTYEFVNPDNIMDLQIFDSEGRLIKELKDNFYPGTTGVINWDGLNEENVKAQVGSYVFLITIFDLDGNRTIYKEVVVLASKL